MNRLKVVAWFTTIMLLGPLMSYSNATNQNKSDVDSELSRIVNLPTASKADVKKFVANQKVRIQSLGEANSTKIETLEKKSSQAKKDNNWKDFVDFNKQIIAIDPNNHQALTHLDYGYMQVGDADRALEYCVKALKILRWEGIYPVVAISYAKKGEKDKALLWLKKAYDGGYMFKSTTSIETYFPKYLDDPKFKTITARNYELLKRCEPYTNFSTKYAAVTLVDPEALVANPFVYEGKTVKLYLRFSMMETATTAIFIIYSPYQGSPIPVALFDDVPKGMYTNEETVLIVGRVIGKTTKKVRGEDMPLVRLKYIEAIKEPPSGCSG